MKLHVLGSSSSGNGYILEGETSALVVEAGVPFLVAKKALNFDISKIEGVLISHCHNDHAGRANEYAAAGIQIYATFDTLQGLDQRYSYRYNQARAGAKYFLNEFSIVPFEVVHDVPCLGYLIKHEECGLTCFITDSMYSPAVFPGLNNILCEANYMEDVLFDNTMSGVIAPSLAERIRQSHMSFETCVEFLKSNDLSAVHNIILLHLSNQNSNAGLMQKQVQAQFGKTVRIAEKGALLELNKVPF